MLGKKQRIGEYIIEDSTEGGMGIVYFVRTEGERPEKFVLKTIRPIYMKEPRVRAAFRREAEFWIRLSLHPNIVTAHRVIEEEGQLYVLAERIMPDKRFGCVSADDWLQIRPFWLLEAIGFAVQVCRAMHWAQKQIPGFIHRDIKPKNLLVAGRCIKVSDFGLGGVVYEIAQTAEVTDAGYSLEAVRGGMSIWGRRAVGTIEYMAPEVIREEGATVRSDIYSFGATLYHMLSGRLVFDGTRREIKEAHLNKPPTPLSKVIDVPSELDAIVMRCLAKDPKERFADFKELGIALQELHISLTGQPVPKSGAIILNGEELRQRINSLKQLGQHQRAQELIEWARASRNPDMLIAVAEVLHEQHRFSEVVKALREAIRDGGFVGRPEYPRILLAVALINLEQWKELRDVTEEALKIAPDNPSLLAYHGIALLMLGMSAEAQKEFQRARALRPDDADIAATIGLVWMKSGDKDESEKWFREALKHNCRNLCALFNLALLCSEKGWRNEAIALWQRFLEVAHPDDPFVEQAKKHIRRLSADGYG